MARGVAHLDYARRLHCCRPAHLVQIVELTAGRLLHPKVEHASAEVEVVLEELRRVLGVALAVLEVFAKRLVVTVGLHVNARHDRPVLAQNTVTPTVVVEPQHDHELHGVVTLGAAHAQEGRGAERHDVVQVVAQAQRHVRCLAVAVLVSRRREHVVHVRDQHHGVPKILLLETAAEEALPRRLHNRPPRALYFCGPRSWFIYRIKSVNYVLHELVEVRPRGPVRRCELAAAVTGHDADAEGAAGDVEVNLDVRELRSYHGEVPLHRPQGLALRAKRLQPQLPRRTIDGTKHEPEA